MSATQSPICPLCGQSDQVEKASTIYLQGLGPLHSAILSKGEVAALRRQLAPPSSGRREVTRPVHPDLVVVVFTAILPAFLIGISRTQGGLMPPALLVLVVFYMFYLWRRKALITRFEGLQQAQQAEKQRVERAIGLWMRLYCCLRDEVVFGAGLSAWVPVERMDELLGG